jgi:hypothetical protein
MGGDLRQTVAAIVAAVKADDAKKPFDVVKRLAGLPVPPPAASESEGAR